MILVKLNEYIPFKYIDDINESKTENWIKSLSPDIIFCHGHHY